MRAVVTEGNAGFLQAVLDQPTVLPVVVGDASPAAVATSPGATSSVGAELPRSAASEAMPLEWNHWWPYEDQEVTEGVIAANAASPYTSVDQLIQAAKGKPNTIAYGSPGNGATPHMAMEFFTRAAGVDLQHIPYKGGSQAITDAIGGQIPLVAGNALEVLPHVKSGKLRVIAVLSPNRSSIYPDVPTIAESGFPGFEASVWYGFIAPAATPKAVVERLHAEVEKALQNPEVRARLANAGGEVLPGTTEQFAALIRAERQRYEKLVREANIKPD